MWLSGISMGRVELCLRGGGPDGSLGDDISIGTSRVDQARKTVEWVAKGGLDTVT